MVVDFNHMHYPEKPTLVLRNPDGTALQTLGYASGLTGEYCLNELSTIQFDVPAFVNGVKTPNYDAIIGLREVLLPEIGLFILTKPKTTGDGIHEIKHCTAYSAESEWARKKMSLTEDVYQFWNPINPDNTLFGILLSYLPAWRAGYVSTSLTTKWRNISSDYTSVYEFVKNTVQKSFGCIFDFDTLTRTVNVYDVNDDVLTKAVYLSTQNLLKEIEIEEDTENIVTSLDVNGADGVNIRPVNPDGTNKILNLDYFIQAGMLTGELAAKWEQRRVAYENARLPYYNLVIDKMLNTAAMLTENEKIRILRDVDLAKLKNREATYLAYLASLGSVGAAPYTMTDDTVYDPEKTYFLKNGSVYTEWEPQTADPAQEWDDLVNATGANAAYTATRDRYTSICAEARARGVKTSRTKYGNINTNEIGHFVWTEELLTQNRTKLEAWYPAETWQTIHDRLLGQSCSFLGFVGAYGEDALPVAYSAIMQDDGTPVLMSRDDVDSYLRGIARQAITAGDDSAYKAALNDCKAVKDEAKELGVDLNKTVYGNVDTNKVKKFTWTPENLEQNRSKLESWFPNKTWAQICAMLEGTYSTVFGMCGEYGTNPVELGFAAIRQTERGRPVLMSASEAAAYLNSIVNSAAQCYSQSQSNIGTMKIGHASIGSNGAASGDPAGDQSGREVCVTDWYAGNWQYVIRAKSSSVAATMASACEAICANSHVGYNQGNRNSLWTEMAAVGWNPSLLTNNCDTDCAAFMAVCARVAGIDTMETSKDLNGEYNSPTVPAMRIAFDRTGQFDILEGDQYRASPAYLQRGDILVNDLEGGHTVMALGATQPIGDAVTLDDWILKLDAQQYSIVAGIGPEAELNSISMHFTGSLGAVQAADDLVTAARNAMNAYGNDFASRLLALDAAGYKLIAGTGGEAEFCAVAPAYTGTSGWIAVEDAAMTAARAAAAGTYLYENEYLQYQSMLDDVQQEIYEKELEIAEEEQGVLQPLKDVDAELQSRMLSIVRTTALTWTDDDGAVHYNFNFTPGDLTVLSNLLMEDSIEESSFLLTEVESYQDNGIGANGQTIQLQCGVLNDLSPESSPGEITKTDYESAGVPVCVYTMRGGTLTIGGDTVLKADTQRIVVEIRGDAGDQSCVVSAHLGQGTLTRGTGDEQTVTSFASGCISVTGPCASVADTDDGDDVASFSFDCSDGSLYFTRNTTEYEKYSVAWDLYEYGEDCLRKLAWPSYSFSVDSANFLALEDFAMFARNLELGKRVYLNAGAHGVLTPILVKVSVDYDDPSKLSLEFGSTFNLSDSSFQLVDLLDQSVSMGKRVDTGRVNYESFVNSGAGNSVKNYMTSALDYSKQMLFSSGDSAITIDDAALWLRKWADASHTTYDDNQIAGMNNSILFTDDNWGSVKMAIGQIRDPRGGANPLFGVVADTLVGTLLAGQNLWIESTKADGDVLAFRIDGNGASLHNAAFTLYDATASGNHGRIDLDASLGIVGGVDGTTSPLFTYDQTTGLINGVRSENGDTLTKVSDVDTTTGNPNANFWIDMDGDVWMRGTIFAESGEFSGIVRAQDFQVYTNGAWQSAIISSGANAGLLDGTYVKNITADTIAANVSITSPTITGGTIVGGSIAIPNASNPAFAVDSNGNVTLAGNITWNANNTPVQYQFSVDGTGNWHTTMQSTDFFRRDSLDGGATWGNPYQFRGEDGNDIQFEYSVDGTGNWHTIMAATDYYRRDSLDGGVTWGTPYQFRGTNGQNAHDIMFQYSVDGTGNWHNTMDQGGVTDYYRRDSLDGGTTWGAVYQFRGTNANVDRLAIYNAMLAAQPNDGLYSVNGDLLIKASAIQAGTISASVEMTAATIVGGTITGGTITVSDNGVTKFAVDSNGNVTMAGNITLTGNITWGNNSPVQYQFSTDGTGTGAGAWHSTMTSADYYRRDSLDGGTTWGAAYQFRGEDGNDIQFEYSVDGTGSWHTTMQATDYYRRDSLDGGTTWGSAYQFRGADGSDADVTRANIYRAMLSDLPADGLYSDPNTGNLLIRASAIQAGTITAELDIQSPTIRGGRYWDEDQESSLYLDYDPGVGNPMMTMAFGSADVVSPSDGGEATRAATSNYDPTADYDVGDHAMHVYERYKCTTPIVGGEAWNQNHWERDPIPRTALGISTWTSAGLTYADMYMLGNHMFQVHAVNSLDPNDVGRIGVYTPMVFEQWQLIVPHGTSLPNRPQGWTPSKGSVFFLIPSTSST